MKFLFWLLTLNSVVNPWIYLAFNGNLVDSLIRIFSPSYKRGGNGKKVLNLPRKARSQRKVDLGSNLLGASNDDFANRRMNKSRSVSPALRFIT